MTRLALGLEYQGAAYCGWQKQPTLQNTLQNVIEGALSKLANENITVTCAGRTDAGVHAKCQVIHLDTTAIRTEYAWVVGTNSYLPKDIRILWVKTVPDDFHARFSATARSYHYYIDNRSIHSPFTTQTITWHGPPLNAKAMQLAANYLVGTHDFNAYRASSCQAKTSVRTLHTLAVTQEGAIITILAEANAFLHHMIRNIVGVLISVGEGKHPPLFADHILQGKDRSLSVKMAPATGLYLTNIIYPEYYNLPIK